MDRIAEVIMDIATVKITGASITTTLIVNNTVKTMTRTFL